jgi:copper chaperone CopZ
MLKNCKRNKPITITGMSCDGCRGKVEKTLNAIEGEAIVSLELTI